MDTPSAKHRFLYLLPFLDERMRRLVAAAEAKVLGYGGVSAVSKETGVSRRAIAQGLVELDEPVALARSSRIRKEGGGRKRAADKDPGLKRSLEALVEATTRGDPQSPLLWTCKSVRKLADELRNMGHTASHQLVSDLLKEMGYSLQANQKTIEGGLNPDRNAQFEHICETVKSFQAQRNPVISVDTKKKELVGNFKNGGRELRPKGEPEQVRVHDFIIPELGKAAPYGVYDVTNNVGWVSVGIDHDTAAFAVNSISSWWHTMGKPTYPTARELLITADGGGSNGYRVRLWKVELQRLANETGLSISVSHLPPGTSKWNKIEHKLFSFITQNWRGKPLVSYEVIVNLIAATTTKTGLKVQSELDTREYPKGVTITDELFDKINIVKHDFHGEWNYTIHPIADLNATFIL
jgi:hypothetical protein